MAGTIDEQPLQAIRALPTLQVSRRCNEETQRFFAKETYDARFCFELFRRAAQEGDELAWDRLYHCYESLLVGWVRRHGAYPSSGESAAHFANRAFERLWKSLAERGIDRFDDLKAVLRYLQLCVHSVVIDHVRAAKLETIAIEDVKHQPASDSAQSAVEGPGGQQSAAQELWNYVETCLSDQQERAVVYATFVLDMKPRQIQAQYEKLFPQISDVYRVKQNVFSRLRRDPKVTALISHD